MHMADEELSCLATPVQALYNPSNILAFAELGSSCELSAQSARAFVRPQELVSYWQLMVSCTFLVILPLGWILFYGDSR